MNYKQRDTDIDITMKNSKPSDEVINILIKGASVEAYNDAH